MSEKKVKCQRKRDKFQRKIVECVELVSMDDPYNTKLVPGCRGTVIAVDSIGTIHVSWDCGSSLGVVYGVDSCRKVETPDG